MDGLVVLGQVLEDGEHHVLLAQAGCVLDLQRFGVAEQVGRGFCLEFGEVHLWWALGAEGVSDAECGESPVRPGISLTPPLKAVRMIPRGTMFFVSRRREAAD